MKRQPQIQGTSSVFDTCTHVQRKYGSVSEDKIYFVIEELGEILPII